MLEWKEEEVNESNFFSSSATVIFLLRFQLIEFFLSRLFTDRGKEKEEDQWPAIFSFSLFSCVCEQSKEIVVFESNGQTSCESAC